MSTANNPTHPFDHGVEPVVHIHTGNLWARLDQHADVTIVSNPDMVREHAFERFLK